jgi:hypothetical protein
MQSATFRTQLGRAAQEVVPSLWLIKALSCVLNALPASVVLKTLAKKCGTHGVQCLKSVWHCIGPVWFLPCLVFALICKHHPHCLAFLRIP